MTERGFTLIELMITIAILAIIVAIAIPSYQNYIEKSRRADAHAALTNAAQQMERCYTRTNTYSSCSLPSTSPDGFYSLALVSADSSATTYKIKATPTGVQSGDDCTALYIDHRGEKTFDGDSSARCWGS